MKQEPTNVNPTKLAMYLTLTVTGILLLLSTFDTNFKAFGINFKNISIISDIYKPSKQSVSILTNDTIGNNNETSNPKVVLNRIDSLNASMQGDTNITFFGPDSLHVLGRFFKALHQAKNKGGKVRIAYFGDSMIEGDLVTQSVRNKFQSTYGGKGVGFVPMTSVVAGFRRTIKHTFSDNWQSYNILEPKDTIKYGISGYVFHPFYYPAKYSRDTIITPEDTLIKLNKISQQTPNEDELSWVRYEAGTASYANLKTFETIKLYYGKTSANCQVAYSTDDNAKTTLKLSGSNSVNEIVLNKNQVCQSFEGTFRTDTLWNLYGMSFENGNGVYLDNYALRGNSGLGISAIPSQVMREFNRYMDYDLIILQFGLNVSDANTMDYGWYSKGMKKVISYLQKNIPTADILLISVGDRAYKNEEGNFVTQPNIPILVEAQRRASQQSHVAFWNLYQAMGGENAMVEWVDAEKPMANKDYTHVNHLGANKIANMLVNHLNAEYNKYVKIAKLPE